MFINFSKTTKQTVCKGYELCVIFSVKNLWNPVSAQNIYVAYREGFFSFFQS
jgi:hypothetical protein